MMERRINPDAPKPFDQRVSALTLQIKNTLIAKNADYGDAFAKRFEKYGMLSALIRIEDKFNRLDNLISGHQAQVDESIEDTCMDMCGYLILTLIELDKQRSQRVKDGV